MASWSTAEVFIQAAQSQTLTCNQYGDIEDMTEEHAKKVCKGCRWNVNKFDKKEKKVIKWCVEANCPVALLNKCPL